MKKRPLSEDEKLAVRISFEHIEKERENNFSPPLSNLMKEISKLFMISVKQRCDITVRFCRGAIFMYLMKNDGVSQQSLAEFAHMTAPTVSAELTEMEKEGLVRREKSGSDARTTLVYLTDKGKETHEIIKDAFMSAERQMLNGFSDEDKEKLLELLVFARANILGGIADCGEENI